MAMKAEYERLIAEHDKTLSLLRSQWLGTDNKTDKARYYNLIEDALGERSRLMKLRDADPE